MENLLKILFLLQVCPVLLMGNPVALNLSDPPCQWKPILDTLAAAQPVKCSFEEARSNPFHKRPKRFKGEIFWYPGNGLCLQYLSPSKMKINISKDSVTVYRKDESPRILDLADNDPALSIFFKLFDWDMDWLNENFQFAGELNEEEWLIVLRPIDEQSKKKLSRIDLKGIGTVLESISLDLSAGKEILITLSGQEIPWKPDQAVQESLFGNPHVEN